MPSVYCGDPVSEKIGFSSYDDTKGDRQALVLLTRDPAEPLKNFLLDVKNQEVEVKWPDLEKGDDYWGGAKAYLDGGGSWKQKWDRQIYFFEVIVGNASKKSDTIMVDPLPPKGPTTKSPQFPCLFYTEGFGTQLGEMFGLNKLPKFLASSTHYAAYDLGKFDLHFKEGEVLIKLALELEVLATSSPVPGNIFDIFKRTVEDFWNGPNGFGGFALHRKDCVRKKDCDCRIVYDLGDHVVSGGCCKIPIRLDIEESGRHNQKFQVHARGMGFGIRDFAPFPDGSPGCINYPEEGTNTWAHEVGHCLGFPDQYLGGALWENHPLGKFPQKRKSIMGAMQSEADEDHLVYVEEFMGDTFTIIRETINR